MSAGFDKSLRLLRREDFLTAQRQGRRVHSAHLVIVLRDRGEGPARLGLVTSRKVGNAVRRNAIRRCLREVFRLHRDLFPSGHDVVIIARDGAGAVATAEIRAEILSTLARRRGPPRKPSTTEGAPR